MITPSRPPASLATKPVTGFTVYDTAPFALRDGYVVAPLRRYAFTPLRPPRDDPPTPTSRPRRTATILSGFAWLVTDHGWFGTDSMSQRATRNESRIVRIRRIQEVNEPTQSDRIQTRRHAINHCCDVSDRRATRATGAWRLANVTGTGEAWPGPGQCFHKPQSHLA
jgi:hypothetical protein